MKTYTTGYDWDIAVDLKADGNPVPITLTDTVRFSVVTTVAPKAADVTEDVDLEATGSAIAVGRIVCSVAKADTVNISPIPHRLEIAVTRGGKQLGPYYSEPFNVEKGFV